MKALSVDLRKRIVEAVTDKGLSKAEVAERFDVSQASVYRYLKMAEDGKLEAQKHPGHPRRLNQAACQKLLEQLESHSDLTLEEHALKFSKEQGIELKKSSIANYFVRLGVRRKKDSTSQRA